jgi:hypothetical protein
MSRLVVKAGIAAAFLSAVNALLILMLPFLLPFWKPVWLVTPFIGVDVAPLNNGSSWNEATLIGLDVAVVLAASFYLDHCVINQPWWAVWLGWGVLLGGAITSTAQDIVDSSHTLFIDINHGLWELGEGEAVTGVLVVFLSWLRAPELFSPNVRRRMVLGWIAVATAVGIAGARIGVPWTMSSILVIIFAVMAGGSLIVRSRSPESISR